MWLCVSLKFIFSCWLYNLKVLFLCLKEAERSVHTAPGFLHIVPWILHKPSERDIVPWPHTFCGWAGKRRWTNRGRNFVRSKRWFSYMSSDPLLIFRVLTIRKHLLKIRFERSGRGQEPSRGHKFSIHENLVRHRDFTSQTLASFPSDLVGACLPQTLLAKWDETSILQKILLLIKIFWRSPDISTCMFSLSFDAHRDIRIWDWKFSSGLRNTSPFFYKQSIFWVLINFFC